MANAKVARRSFIRNSIAAGALLPLSIPIALRAQEQLSEDDAQATALGYKHDSTKVDASKFPQHTNEQLCSNCQLYQGAAGDDWGPCGIFPGKVVSAKGWCSAWVKKAG